MGGELGTTRDPQTPSHRSALASGLFRFTQLIMNKYKNKKITPEGIFPPASNYGTNRNPLQRDCCNGGKNIYGAL